MAANGFIELLRLAKRGNKNYVSNENEVNRWSGIAFEMMGQYFVAPLGEVAEVIYPPKSLYTTNFIEPLSYQAFSFLKLRALS